MDPMIYCVKSQTHYTVSNMKHGEVYYFNLFATNKQTNLSYPYGGTQMKFDNRVRPTSLKDGKLNYVNLKKNDGKTVLRYKVRIPIINLHRHTTTEINSIEENRIDYNRLLNPKKCRISEILQPSYR